MIKKIAVIGDPVAHSLSPRIHNHWIVQHGLSAHYDAVRIEADNFDRGIDDLLGRGYRGWNVTLPHKISMMMRCDHVDNTARAIGAVNTVVVSDDGTLHGTNTDAYGFIAHLEQSQPGWQAKVQYALVLGAGGAARAVVTGLMEAGVAQIILANRTKEAADALAAEHADVQVINWDDRHDAMAGMHLIVNTTALGMAGQPPLDLNLDQAMPGTIVYDIVYRPLMTELIQAAHAKGLPVVTGLGMLLHQARPAFKAWFDILPVVDHELMDAIAKGL